LARYSRVSSPKISRFVYILCMEGTEARYRVMDLCPPAALTGHHGDLSAEGVPLLRHWLRQLLDAYMSNYRDAQPMNAVCEPACLLALPDPELNCCKRYHVIRYSCKMY
jgi:hypothetical protein